MTNPLQAMKITIFQLLNLTEKSNNLKKACRFFRWIQMYLVRMLLEKPMERKKWNNKKDKKGWKLCRALIE